MLGVLGIVFSLICVLLPSLRFVEVIMYFYSLAFQPLTRLLFYCRISVSSLLFSLHVLGMPRARPFRAQFARASQSVLDY